MSAKLIQVIQVETPRGRGVEEDPIRTVTQFWSTDGKLLAENDMEKQVAMSRSQASALMKNHDLQKARYDGLMRWLKERRTLKPPQFKEAIELMLERIAQSPGWQP